MQDGKLEMAPDQEPREDSEHASRNDATIDSSVDGNNPSGDRQDLWRFPSDSGARKTIKRHFGLLMAIRV